LFEASHSQRSSSPASSAWAKWVNPARWPDWDPRVADAEADAPLAAGVTVRVKLHKGGRVAHEVIELEPDHRLVTEYRLPGARVGHERIVESRGPGAELTHRLYVEGPFAWLWATMLGRRKMREQVASFTDG
jgi:uncharacterized protein YndB with AHSA1/START domain